MMKKILVIEDTDALRDQIVFTLKMEGYNVYSAIDGKSGVDLALRIKPDLILCDILMPGLDGYGVLQLLKEIDSQAVIPFIFITALGERKNFREGMELGADDYLVKPFSVDELRKAVEAQLKKYSSFDSLIKNQIEKIEADYYTRMNNLRKQAEIQKSEIRDIAASKEKILGELKEKQAQLMQEALRSIEINSILQEMAKKIKEELTNKNILEDYRSILIGLRNKIRKKSALLNNWTIFQLKFDLVYPDITTLIINKYPDLNPQERLIISALYTNLNAKQLSIILNVQPASIRKYKYRLKLKLGLSKEENIQNFVHKLKKQMTI